MIVFQAFLSEILKQFLSNLIKYDDNSLYYMFEW